ncbi:MAG: hypothetical protein FJY85_02445 [Deltaproteobacteria bacterium]|nr:hypothetical protein [Deltaproteobacteria bacterium]
MADEFSYVELTESVEANVVEAVRRIVSIAQATLREQGTHIPTAVVHTLEGLFPILLPFKDAEQKRALVDYVKEQALESHAYAVTTITCAKIVDSRTGCEDEALVLATSVQGGRPYMVVQRFSRDSNRVVHELGELIEGDEAAMPGQMIIFPDWDQESKH